MFSVEIKFRAGDREVSLARFATLFLKESLGSAQTAFIPQSGRIRVGAARNREVREGYSERPTSAVSTETNSPR